MENPSSSKKRLNVYLRDTGKASRREADDLILAGKVLVNGRRAELGMVVGPEDKVEIRGKDKNYRYFLYHKPAGVVTTTPQRGEKDILDTAKFPKMEGKLFPIGRLDKDSTGLIVMTNDGRITQDLLSPDKEHEKEYVVTVDKKLSGDFKKKMESGVVIGGDKKMDEYRTRQCKVTITGDRSFSIVITEGKNRQIRRMCQALGYSVIELKRVRIGKFMLGKLKPNEWREIKRNSFV